MVTKKIIDDIKEKKLMAIGGIIYISNGKLIASAHAKPEDGFGRALLNNFYEIDASSSEEDYKRVIAGILSDALYHKEKGLEFATDKEDLITKQIKKDKKDKVISNSLYITLDYCYSDILKDKFSITLCERDGSAWIGRDANTYTFEKDDVDGLIKKVKGFINQNKR